MRWHRPTLTPAVLASLLLLGGCLGEADSVLLLDPDRVEVVSGDGQVGAPGSVLPDPVVIRVVDEGGAPLEGLHVTWTALDGSASPAAGLTDGNGRASTTWTLGDGPGEQELLVAVTRTPQVSARITATAEEDGM